MFNFSNYYAKSKYCDDSNALVVGKMKDYIGDLAIEDFVGLQQKMYSILVSHPGEYKKANGVNKTAAAKISHNIYKMFCWTKKV